jgi:predicted nucleotidyltransferase
MNVGQPYTAVSPTVAGEVLITLSRTSRPLTGREVAKLAQRGTQPSVQRALNHLVAEGLVVAQEAGRAILYTLNRDHVAYPAVEILAGLRSEFVERLRGAIGEWKIQPGHASVFGSAARGDGDVDSDIDLFVVRPAKVDEEDPTWRTQLDELTDSIKRWTGNRANVSEIGERDVARLRRERPPVVSGLEQDSIVLAGLPTKELLGGQR